MGAIIACIGALAYDTFAHPGQTAEEQNLSLGTITHGSGGVTRNMAESFTRFDDQTYLFTCVGEDPAGKFLLDEARQTAINVEFIQVVPELPTAKYVALLDSNGSVRSDVFDGEILQRLTVAYLHKIKEIIEAAQLIVTDLNIPAVTLDYLTALARNAQIPLFINATSAPLARRARTYLKMNPMIGMNQIEATELSGSPIASKASAAHFARTLLREGARAVIITLGEHGYIYADRDNHALSGGALPARVQNTSGAGDAFYSAFLADYLAGHPAPHCLEFANAAAAITVESALNVSPALTTSAVLARMATPSLLLHRAG